MTEIAGWVSPKYATLIVAIIFIIICYYYTNKDKHII